METVPTPDFLTLKSFEIIHDDRWLFPSHEIKAQFTCPVAYAAQAASLMGNGVHYQYDISWNDFPHTFTWHAIAIQINSTETVLTAAGSNLQ